MHEDDASTALDFSERPSHTTIDPICPDQESDCQRQQSQISGSTLPKNTASEAQDDSQKPNKTAIDPQFLRLEFGKILDLNPIGFIPSGKHVPDEELDRLLTVETIASALGGDIHESLLKYTLRERKVFATLQLVHHDPQLRRAAMKAFQSSGFTDDLLTSRNLAICDPPPCKEDCEHHFPRPTWDSGFFDHLETVRWQFLVPKFDHQQFQYDVHADQLMPFKRRDGPQQRAEGFFSEVDHVDMLYDKQNTIKSANKALIPVALKTLKRVKIDDQAEPYDIETEWLREVKAHKELNGMHEHLVQGIVAYRRISNNPETSTYHVVLEWADGGNLCGFWGSQTEAQLSDDLAKNRWRIKTMLQQLLGLTKCLEHMHTKTTQVGGFGTQNSDADTQLSSQLSPAPGQTQPSIAIDQPEESTGLEYWRHGDIKPDNVLRFIEGDGDAWLGTLKLADLGRAQQHLKRTALRHTTEREQYRTVYYEPPDLYKGHGRISRLFDVWSMGCVIFEAVVWMLYGSEAIKVFQDNPEIDTDKFNGTPYWIRNGGQYMVIERAVLWMDHMLKTTPRWSKALEALVRLVKQKLLVVELPADSEQPTETSRTNASTMRREIELILQKAASNDEYLFDGHHKFDARRPFVDQTTANLELPRTQGGPPKHGNMLSPPDAAAPKKTPGTPGHPTTLAASKVYSHTIGSTWQGRDDESFAKSITTTRPSPSDIDKLCATCARKDMMSEEVEFELGDASTKVDQCSLCTLISKAVARAGLDERGILRLTRESDHFVVQRPHGTVLKFLRLCRTESSNDADWPITAQVVPLGAPDLCGPQPEALESFFELPNAWLKECEHSHKPTCGSTQDRYRLPKRLVCVKDIKRPRIIDSNTLTDDPEDQRYIAFSHKWGKMPNEARTTIHNLGARRTCIPERELPKSFLDVIAVTRALDCNYLWIDSLCINQRCDDDEGDFKDQADSMQSIYTNAYCVIAASKANGATEGFLHRKADLGSVKKDDIYISAVTNDFTRDVLNSPLNRRGWVLQERALARRTIFFTETQMYWECGDGIRCETLRKLQHDEVAFLGDAHFPSAVIKSDSTRGSQIRLWTRLFEDYSALELSHRQDRAVAIQGLMARLTHAFRTQNIFGLFTSFWGRCLLWRRPQRGVPKGRIPQGDSPFKLPPTWSWMAVEGPIYFLQPEGGEVIWNAGDVALPLVKDTHPPQLEQPESLPRRPADSIAQGDAIRATAFSFATSKEANIMQDLHYDDEMSRVEGHVKAVIICTSKDGSEHNVILVLEADLATTPPTYERVGVGRIPAVCIDRSTGVRVAVG
ncbi:hypothetical protein E8E12_009880 [Didymella heteroderae]|uniref:Protein kinase domain-containing protein n=1 Tax=Didymella heteroderae TaxID=1769908 RepID=A0A9P4X1Y2_9PLEO|nr:hypothetical protein E8E12_009880 [Didymella heteroderae]